MSMESPQQKAASETAAWQAALSQQLAGIALPELQAILGGRNWVVDQAATPGSTDAEGNYTAGTPEQGHWETTKGSLSDLLAGTQGGSQKSALDQAAYQSALGQLNQGYDQQGRIANEALSYQGLRSGESRRSPTAMSSSIGQAATALDKDRMSALRNLEFTSAQTSMADYNKLLQLMGQGTQTALGLAGGFSSTSNAALSGLSNVSPGASALGGASAGGALGGAIAGAGWGTAAGPYGALIGAAIGGVGGYVAGGG
jgi:hypothetical protein